MEGVLDINRDNLRRVFYSAGDIAPPGWFIITLSKLVNPIYILLTLLKAYFIVAFFMHLKFEKVGLALAIIVPILFIIGLILVLTNESHYWIDLRL